MGLLCLIWPHRRNAARSKLAPTVDRVAQTSAIQCGSELARDGGLTVTINPNISPIKQKRRFHPRQKRQRHEPQRINA
ncbi:hypothetical protein VD17_20430 [Pseudomonas fluorescens]|uniref:Uncharacterized protein n=1 Tax=Pseudomonas fluorescens TaxID=294 RepID=A0A0F4V540_PSEFL|nr:hypothetical protein VD17_20430 [Pseudomonas fluorescens]